ncbi:NUDIX hydrolase [Streptomyces sp. SM18]|nr:NUDIX hydrolase [Streptomyces sp. SM18]
MSTTSAPGERPGVAMTDEAYGALRASHALWAGTSVLITDQHGRILVQRVGYRPTRLLPGGALDPGESPAQGAARELEEELGLAVPLTRGLAVDWVSPAGRRTSPEARFPGELLHVFDGGVWDEDRIASIRPAPGEIEGVDFVEPAELPALMSPDDARRALSALRARVNGAGPAILEDGRPLAPTLLDRVNAFTRRRAVHHWPWQDGPAPARLPVHQSWGWLFAPDVMQAECVSIPLVSQAETVTGIVYRKITITRAKPFEALSQEHIVFRDPTRNSLSVASRASEVLLLRRPGRGGAPMKPRHLEVAGHRGGVIVCEHARAGRGRQSVLLIVKRRSRPVCSFPGRGVVRVRRLAG